MGRKNFKYNFRLPLFAVFIVLVKLEPQRRTFKGLYSKSQIVDSDLVSPQRVNQYGHFISHNLTHFHQRETSLHYNVTIGNKNHSLILYPQKDFLAPNLLVERRKGKNLLTRKKVSDQNCHFLGKVHNDPHSRVAISTCNGLTGFIHMKQGKFYIEPAHDHNDDLQSGHKHFVFKRSTSNEYETVKPRKRKKKRRRNHLKKNCGTRDPKRRSELEWMSHMGKLTVQGKRHKFKRKKFKKAPEETRTVRSKTRGKRSISKARFVETLLVADSSMIEFHEDGDVETYLLTIMNMVSSLYLDPSIGNLIKVVVVKIVLIDDPSSEPALNVTVNADATLRSFCKWQKDLNPSDDSDPEHHDVAILVTRQDICARHDTPCNTLGVAHVGGMCKSGRSCSVNEDNGITLAHTIAHEMGHNFGMYHDTDKIGCKGREGSRLHIMTPSFEADTVEVSWSRCSRRDVTNFFDKGFGDCLKDSPSEQGEYEYPELPAGAMYDAEYQCRLQFGAAATVCVALQEICSRLWCQVNGTCTTQLRPAAPGTHCGKHMWCQEQKCVPIMERPVAIDGGWGEWSSWSECSRSCGAGVSAMERDCDHPRPSAGGQFCTGERRRYRICNNDPCPSDRPTFRSQQCTSFNNHTHEGKLYTWQPHFDKSEPCELFCTDANDSVMVSWGEHALDGTPCNVGSRDVCISGICKKVGCDWVVDSRASEDECGVCQGDGSTCDTIKGIYNKQGLGAGYREMFVVPAGSRNIRVEEIDYSENYISIASASLSRRFYLNGKRHITLPGEYTVAGVQALYERDNELEKIRIPGPIQESVLFYIIFRGKTFNPGIKYQFTMSKKEAPKQVKYEWILSDWSQCSVTCGGGVQRRKPLCQESLIAFNSTVIDGTSNVVDESLCDNYQESAILERTCNEDQCPYHWWIGPWQACPVTCSLKDSRPLRRRSVMCVDGQEIALPDRFCSGSNRPKEREHCKGLPICPDD